MSDDPYSEVRRRQGLIHLFRLLNEEAQQWSRRETGQDSWTSRAVEYPDGGGTVELGMPGPDHLYRITVERVS